MVTKFLLLVGAPLLLLSNVLYRSCFEPKINFKDKLIWLIGLLIYDMVWDYSRI